MIYARRRKILNVASLPVPRTEALAKAAHLTKRIQPERPKSVNMVVMRSLPTLSIGSSNRQSTSALDFTIPPCMPTNFTASENDRTVSPDPTEVQVSKYDTFSVNTCQTCGKGYSENSNYDGACTLHPEGSTLLNIGTSMEVSMVML